MAVPRPRRRLWMGAVLLFVLLFAATMYDAPQWWNRIARGPMAWAAIPERPFRLGLDLKGGTHLVYQADVSAIPDGDQRVSMEGVRDVIERRINALGVAEPVVQLTRVEGTWRLIVELAGVYDTQEAIAAIGTTPVLEFKEQNTEIRTLTAEQRKDLDRRNREAKKRAEEIFARAQKPKADFAALAREWSDDPGSKEQGGDLGWFRPGIMVQEFNDAVFGAKTIGVIPRLVESPFGWHIIRKEEERAVGEVSLNAVTESGAPVNATVTTPDGASLREVRASHILIRKQTEQDVLGPQDPWKYTGLGGKQLKRAFLQFDPTTNAAEIGLQFNDEGKALFAAITERNLGKPIAIFLDGKSPVDTDGDGVITDADLYAPVVQGAITGGEARVTGTDLTVDRAKMIARRLQAGALPVPVHLLAQTTIGATLGETAVAASLRAALLGYVLVAFFMLFRYRLAGLVADIALVGYVALVLAVMKLLGATLTLAGIAGFVMSIGVAVDANVLIFERFREELRNGRSLLDALEQGFLRAWTSIRDSNVSALITCLILITFSSSVVKGFAVTLGIGVLVSMFTAISVTRTLLLLVAGWAQGMGWYGVRPIPAAAATAHASDRSR
ncbi:protein translocase subunit SecD [Candidatus Uhrbacteria bacterium]|nr:protein translocase subunit SecD [Candidatus Uhrbacteria bacterium]